MIRSKNASKCEPPVKKSVESIKDKPEMMTLWPVATAAAAASKGLPTMPTVAGAAMVLAMMLSGRYRKQKQKMMLTIVI